MRIAEKDTNVGIGLPSVILIAVVLAVTVLALLGLRSAQAEKKLADKTAEAVAKYYALEGLAEERIAEIDAIVSGEGKRDEKLSAIEKTEGVTETAIVKDAKDKTVYAVTMYVEANAEDGMGILVRADFREDGSGLDIKEWKYVKEEPDGYELMLPD